MQMFYTSFSSNAQNRHKQRKIPSPIPTPPESLRLREDDADEGGILFVYRGFGLLEGSFCISGFSRILSDFYPKCFTHVLQFYYVLHSTTEKVRLKGLKTVEKRIINN
jgi:hypothetical protein